MPVDTFNLTTDKDVLPQILHAHCVRSESQLMIRRVNWLLAWYYMNGYRRFNVYDPVSGMISPQYLTTDQKMEYQSTKLLYVINQMAGRFQSMDYRPSATRQGGSLASMQNRAVSQITADAITSTNHIEEVKEHASYLLTCLGSVGLCGHLVDHPTIGLTSDIEVVHPRELLPFPVQGQDHTKVRGIIRQRMVPLSYLKEVYGARRIEARLDNMERYQRAIGDAMLDADNNNDSSASGVTWFDGSKGTSTRKSGDTTLEVARIRELWLYGPNGTTRRYIATCGMALLDDQDLSDVEAYCPIGFARFLNNGTFHGTGMFDLLFSIHRELETLQKTLFDNVRNLDRYGMLVIPAGQMNQNTVLKDVGRGLKAVFYEPDPIAEGFNPFAIQPVTTGDMPGRVAAHASELIDGINPIRDLIQEKGRVDSAPGLAFLDEQINRAITTPSLNIQRMWGTMYKSLVQKAAQNLAVSKRSLPVGELTLDLAGAIIDPATDSVSFADNPLPDVSRINFTIRSASPKSEVALKQEAIDLWVKGVEQDPLNFRLYCLKAGLDIPLYIEDDRGAYQSTIRLILTLYNDGQEPGFIAPAPHTTKPDLALRILAGFMTSPAMQVASVEVVDAFLVFRETLMMFAGISLPQAVPNPDDAAMLNGAPPPGLPGGSPQLALA